MTSHYIPSIWKYEMYHLSIDKVRCYWDLIGYWSRMKTPVIHQQPEPGHRISIHTIIQHHTYNYILMFRQSASVSHVWIVFLLVLGAESVNGNSLGTYETLVSHGIRNHNGINRHISNGCVIGAYCGVPQVTWFQYEVMVCHGVRIWMIFVRKIAYTPDYSHSIRIAILNHWV